MWNAGLDEAQAGIEIAGQNISIPLYADHITFMAESKEEFKKSFDEGEKGNWKDWLKNSTFKKQGLWHQATSRHGK